MQHIYCTQCGHKNPYTGVKSKFCSNCGAPLSFDSKAENKFQIKRTQNSRVLAEDELLDDESDINEVPYIESLSYEIDSSGMGYKLHKFENFIDAKKEEPKPSKRPRKRKRK